MQLLEALILIAATLLVERGVNVPRDIRRNNERIRNRNEDLATWIEDDNKELRRKFIQINVKENQRKVGPDYSATQYQKAKDQVLHRYREQLRDAERTVREVGMSEQLPHRVLRKVLRKPRPKLTARDEQADVLSYWEKPADEEYQVKLRTVAREFGRLAAKN